MFGREDTLKPTGFGGAWLSTLNPWLQDGPLRTDPLGFRTASLFYFKYDRGCGIMLEKHSLTRRSWWDVSVQIRAVEDGILPTCDIIVLHDSDFLLSSLAVIPRLFLGCLQSYLSPVLDVSVTAHAQVPPNPPPAVRPKGRGIGTLDDRSVRSIVALNCDTTLEAKLIIQSSSVSNLSPLPLYENVVPYAEPMSRAMRRLRPSSNLLLNVSAKWRLLRPLECGRITTLIAGCVWRFHRSTGVSTQVDIPRS